MVPGLVLYSLGSTHPSQPPNELGLQWHVCHTQLDESYQVTMCSCFNFHKSTFEVCLKSIYREKEISWCYRVERLLSPHERLYVWEGGSLIPQ